MLVIAERVESFLEDSGMKPTNFGKLTVGNPNLVTRLRKGGDVTTRNAAKIQSFIEEYWSKNPKLEATQRKLSPETIKNTNT